MKNSQHITQSDSTHSSDSKNDLTPLEQRTYPTALDLRVISLTTFETLVFIQEKKFQILESSQAFSKNEKFITTRLTIVFESFKQYVELRDNLQKQPDVQLVL